MEISGTLAVDGYIKANSYDTTSTIYNGASGGSGGSIYIQTGNFTGYFLFFKLLDVYTADSKLLIYGVLNNTRQGFCQSSLKALVRMIVFSTYEGNGS